MCGTEKEVLSFLTELYETGIGYSGLNSARSALSAIIWNDSGLPIGKFPTVKRFMKGVFENRPTFPKYSYIWDVTIVLNYLKIFYPLENITLEQLSHKLVTLLALVTAQRAQTLRFLRIENMYMDLHKCVFEVKNKLKQTNVNRHLPPIILQRYVELDLCVVTTIENYLMRTEKLRGSEKQLLISYTKPHRAITEETISRWLKRTLYEAGIDTETFKGHSTRAASVSAAKELNVDFQDIVKTAGWTNAKTFAIYYDKPVYSYSSFGNQVLASGQCS